MKVVTDTGPVNYLICIGQVSLLPALFAKVWMPATVRRELELPDAPASVRQWIVSPPTWLSFVCLEAEGGAGLERLGTGERDAIALAESLVADLVLMDDRQGVSIARARGLTVTGTLGVLAQGADRGLVDLADAFDRLKGTSFRVRPELLGEILRRHERVGCK